MRPFATSSAARARALLLVLALAPALAGARLLNDLFPGTRLGEAWAWANEDDCVGAVEGGLSLGPRSPFRQAAIATATNRYSWIAAGNARNYQFTIRSWRLDADSGVSARLFLVGEGHAPQPAAFSDYNAPAVVMAKLERWEGVFFWNLYLKTDRPKSNADDETNKLSWIAVGPAAGGCTFGLRLHRNSARLWWRNARGETTRAEPVILPTDAFSRETTFYVGAKNNTGEPFGDGQFVSFSGVAITP